jgi:hypothetical protein
MKTKDIQNLIAEAVSLDRSIAEQTARLKDIKAALAEEAAAHEAEHTPTDGGGASWRAEGADGNAAVITFPAPRLASSLDPETKKGAQVLELVRGHKDNLFTPRLDYVPVENFREEAARLLETATARKVIKLLTSASAPRVSFETSVE